MSERPSILAFRPGAERERVSALLERARRAGDEPVFRAAYVVLYATAADTSIHQNVERRDEALAALEGLSASNYYNPALPPFAVRRGKDLIRPRFRIPGHAGGPGHRAGDGRWYE